ncbi:MAG: NADPH:quinone reductase [Alphaproteobacteria bacterium]|nr:NADPH:quinone reductase [Alphaproteobacteria bacterium]
MRAWWYEESGSVDVLQFSDIADLEPDAGEVRIRVAYSMTNPTDAKRRETGRDLTLFKRIVPNNDGSGVIDKVGAGVDAARIGERVWIFGAQSQRPWGTAAEFSVVPSNQAIKLPDNATLAQGACLGVPAVTAHCGLFADGPLTNKTVLVSGASGRVGAYGVQLAKWAGAATVIGTAGSAEKLAYVQSLGADHTIDYNDDRLVDTLLELTNGRGVDLVLDVAFAKTIQMAPQIIAANGVITNYANDGGAMEPTLPVFRDLMQKCITMRPYAIYTLPQERRDHAYRDITTCLSSGALSHRIVGPRPIEDMPNAHELVGQGKVFGCLLIEIDGSLS